MSSLGQACKAVLDVKSEFGLPSGCGAHNAIATWRGLKSKMGEQAVKPCQASIVTTAVAAGADFALWTNKGCLPQRLWAEIL
jgi:tetrahydromethanopterin S-methyltransferase subunit H